MTTYNRQRVRVIQDVAKWSQSGEDLFTATTPQFAVGAAVRFEFAFSFGEPATDDQLIDMDEFSSVTLDVKRLDERVALPLMSKTVAAVDFNSALTLAEWEDGSSQHVSFEFDDDETDLFINEDQETLWMVVSAVTTAGQQLPLAAWPISIVEDGAGVDTPVYVVEPTYYTAAQSDARYLAAADLTAKVSRDGSLDMTGHLKLLDSSPTDPLHAASKGYVDSQLGGAAYVPVAGATTVTGAKTFSALLTASAGVTVSGGSLTVGALSGVLKAAAGVVSGSATTTDLAEGTNLYHTSVRVDARITAARGAADGIAPLDSSSLVPVANMPPKALQLVHQVASQSAQTSLTAYKGNLCIRTDTSETYALSTDDPSVFANWLKLPGTGVTSVNGASGAVTLTTANITEVTNLYYTDARVRACLLTGINTGSGGAVSASDSVLSAFGKLQYRVNLNDAKVTGSDRVLKTGDTMTGALQFSGTTHLGLKVLSLTNAQAAALSISNGYIYYDTTLDKLVAVEGSTRKQVIGTTSGGGTTWLAGSGDPGGGTGSDGNYYLDEDDGEIWRKASGTWSLVSSAKLPIAGGTMSGALYFANDLDPFLEVQSWRLRTKVNVSNPDFEWVDVSDQVILRIAGAGSATHVTNFGGSFKVPSGYGFFVDGVQVVTNQQAFIAAPSGGGTQDSEARTAIDSIRTLLINHGLMAAS